MPPSAVFVFLLDLLIFSSMVLRTFCTLNINGIRNQGTQDLFKKFLFDLDVDICFLQEVNDTHLDFLPQGYSYMANPGPKFRGTAIVHRSSLQPTNIEMEPDGRILSCTLDGTTLVNVYAPSGSTQKRERETLFTQRLVYHLRHHAHQPVVMAGDWNSILDARDHTGSFPAHFSPALYDVIGGLRLDDAWQQRRPNEAGFTFIKENCKARLDRLYLTPCLTPQVQSIDLYPQPYTDHVAVCMKMNVTTKVPTKRRGLWKLPIHRLKNPDVVTAFKEKYKQLQRRKPQFSSVCEWWLRAAKPAIKAFFRTISFKMTQEEKRTLEFYYAVLSDLYVKMLNGEQHYSEFREVKLRILQYQQQLTEGVKYQTPPQSYVAEEQISLFHLVSTKKMASDIEQSPDFLAGAATYFNQVYADPGDTCDPNSNILTAYDKFLPQPAVDALTNEISVEEVQLALKTASKRKSPGEDSLPYEFYQTFQDLVVPDLTQVLNEVFAGKVSTCMKDFCRGVIVLVPKVSKPENIQQFRPITLLNCDYKALMKIFATRVKQYLPEILGPGQTCCVQGRTIIDNLVSVRNIISFYEQNKTEKAALLGIDFVRAFDSVSHSYLFTLLEKLKFPPKMLQCLRQVYSSATSKISHLGEQTAPITIARGTRQGCPFSMALFAIALEPIIHRLNTTLSGLELQGELFVCKAFADDLVIQVKNNLELAVIENELLNFHTLSGIGVNPQKSQCLVLNDWPDIQVTCPIVDAFKYLGLTFKHQLKDTITLNWNKVQNTVRLASLGQASRRLNIIQKVWHINLFILSKVWYTAQVLPAFKKNTQTIEKYIGFYLWKGLPYRVAREQLRMPTKSGGLGLLDVYKKSTALLLRTLKRDFVPGSDPFNHAYIVHLRQGGGFRNFPAYLRTSCGLLDSLPDNLYSAKHIYQYLLSDNAHVPAIQIKEPLLPWARIWKNVSIKCIPSAWKSWAYLAMNDAIATGERLQRHGRAVDPNCPKCHQLDTISHRLIMCPDLANIRHWVSSAIRTKIKYQGTEERILTFQFQHPDDTVNNAIAWLISGFVAYTLTEDNPALVTFISYLRQERWRMVRHKLLEANFKKKLFFF